MLSTFFCLKSKKHQRHFLGLCINTTCLCFNTNARGHYYSAISQVLQHMERQRQVASRVLVFSGPPEYYGKYETVKEAVPVNEKKSILYFCVTPPALPQIKRGKCRESSLFTPAKSFCAGDCKRRANWTSAGFWDRKQSSEKDSYQYVIDMHPSMCFQNMTGSFFRKGFIVLRLLTLLELVFVTSKEASSAREQPFTSFACERLDEWQSFQSANFESPH